MKRSDLAHILRAACEIVQDPEILVIGSQAILASYSETELPPEATRSMEADIAFFDDPDEAKSDLVDGQIGELSLFHESFGFYGQGVGLATARLPSGWENRLVAFDAPDAGESHAVCLDPHDLVVAKLVRGEEKDREFARALLKHGLADVEILRERAQGLSSQLDRKKVTGWLDSV